MNHLKEGTKAPDFSLLDQNGTNHNLSSYLGKIVLIYFYPKDDTPGCTKEACGIRDSYDEFEKLDVVVFGISPDSPESHAEFIQKYNLPFILLSDHRKEMIAEYGADGIMTKRISYLIGKDGYILKTYPKVDPTSHAEEILNDVKTYL